MLYLDTSLLVSAFTHEARTDAIQDWLGAQIITELTISDWVATEFSSALAIKLRTGQLSKSHRAAALATFTQMASEVFRILAVERVAFQTAAHFVDIPNLNLRAGDALHIAICAQYGATLCTMDHRMSEAAGQVGVSVILL